MSDLGVHPLLLVFVLLGYQAMEKLELYGIVVYSVLQLESFYI